jgi:Predicted membrane protein
MTHVHASLPRYWEIDLFRGIGVLMMVVFHVVFDLAYFSILPIPVSTGFWRMFAIATASIFLFLVGISLSIRWNRTSVSNRFSYVPYLKRGCSIFALGVGITFVTYLVIGEGFILFGILHCIGASILIAPLFFGHPRIGLLAGAASIAAGFLVSGINGPIWLAPIGIHPPYFYTLDYFPLFPWLGVILLGLTAGTLLYPKGMRAFPLSDRCRIPGEPVCWMGRHSLVLYLVHQPVILGILALLFPGSIGFFS